MSKRKRVLTIAFIVALTLLALALIFGRDLRDLLNAEQTERLTKELYYG